MSNEAENIKNGSIQKKSTEKKQNDSLPGKADESVKAETPVAHNSAQLAPPLIGRPTAPAAGAPPPYYNSYVRPNTPPMYGPSGPSPMYGPPNNPAFPGFTPYISPRATRTYNKTDAVAAVLVFLIGLLVMRHMIWYPNGLFSTLTVLAGLGIAIWYLVRKQLKFRFENYINIGAILLFSLIFSFTSDGFIKFFTFIVTSGSLAYLIFSVGSGRRFSEFFFRDQSNALMHPFYAFGDNFSALSKNSDKKGKSKNVLYIILGLLVALPLFIIVLVTLASADQAMAKLVDNIFKNISKDIFIIIVQVILGIPIAMYFFGMLYTNGSKLRESDNSDETYTKKSAAGRVLPSAAIYGAILPIIMLYALFFFSQLPYYLSGFSGELPNGFTYVTYAVRGFEQLVFLTVFNLIIITLIQRFARGSAEKKSLSIKILSILLSLSTLVLVASAFSKLIMYIQEYGLTRQRVLSAWLIAVIGIVFVLIIIKQIFGRMPLIRSIVVVSVLMFAVLAFSRIDYQIARFNIEMYKTGKHQELDAEYLVSSLGDESLLYIVEHDEIETLQKAYDDRNIINNNDIVEKGKYYYDYRDENGSYYDESRYYYYSDKNTFSYYDHTEGVSYNYEHGILHRTGYMGMNWIESKIRDAVSTPETAGQRLRYYNYSSWRLRQLVEEKI